jgi:hypothetical protein
MTNQLTSNAEALRLFFTEDIYLVPESKVITVVEQHISEKHVEQSSSMPDIPTPIIQPTAPKVTFNYLGKNQKNILILVNDSQNDVSTEQGRELLRKLVKAIDLTANDFALVNYANYLGQKYTHLKDAFNCRLILAFGVAARDLDLPEQSSHQLVSHDNIKLVFTSNLDELDRDQASKKKLWASLQQLK